MKYLFTLVYIILSTLNLTFAQTESYKVRKAVFSSDKYDEFSPEYYRNGIVFISNRTRNAIVSYSDSETKGQFKIYYMDTVQTGKWTDSRYFSSQIKSKVNEGPLCFNRTKDTIYYTRNIFSDGNIKDLNSTRNKLGIFTAICDGRNWSKIKDFRFNDEWYNVSTPCLSPDGKRLYFSSDKPGGYGGSDLYYCEWKGQYWNNPVNLGPVINTKGNESFPFLSGTRDLFFSSDGHSGFGGKDIFYSRRSDTTWSEPVILESPINSSKDDFGFICDSLMNSGYFSTNREKTYDIYSFITVFHQPFYCDSQLENTYHFSFSQPDNIKFDRNNLRYEWDFGDGTKNGGFRTTHDFQGPGRFNIRLNLIDISTGSVFFTRLSYVLDLKDIEQPFIRSEPTGISRDSVKFDAVLSNLPGYKILDYTWDFGDGAKDKGIEIKHFYKDPRNIYNVKLNLTVQDIKSGIVNQTCVSLKTSGSGNSVRNSDLSKTQNETATPPTIESYEAAKTDSVFSADREILKDAVFQLELFNSKTRIDTSDVIFSKIPGKYIKREIFRPENKCYSYIIDEEPDIMSLYESFAEIIRKGYQKAVVKTFIPSDPAEKELNVIKKVYGTSTDVIFEKYDFRLSAAGSSMFDQVIALMKKYPRLRLMIIVHNDYSALSSISMDLTQGRAYQVLGYLQKNGISPDRLIAKGMGSQRPLTSNATEAGRKLNRRIEFIKIR